MVIVVSRKEKGERRKEKGVSNAKAHNLSFGHFLI